MNGPYGTLDAHRGRGLCRCRRGRDRHSLRSLRLTPEEEPEGEQTAHQQRQLQRTPPGRLAQDAQSGTGHCAPKHAADPCTPLLR